MKSACVLVAAFGVIGFVAGIYSNVLLAIHDGQGPANTTNATTVASSSSAIEGTLFWLH